MVEILNGVLGVKLNTPSTVKPLLNVTGPVTYIPLLIAKPPNKTRLPLTLKFLNLESPTTWSDPVKYNGSGKV